MPKLSKPRKMLGKKPEVLYGTFRRPRKLRLVRPVVSMAMNYVIVWRTLSGKLNSFILQGHLRIFLVVYQILPNFTGPKRVSLRGGTSGRSI